MTTQKVFISHASKDKALVDKFVDLILTLGCGLPRDQIYDTSDPDMGVDSGKDFIQHIKDHITNASLVIFLISPNFYNSVFCLGEIGAAWALNKEVFPIVIPPFQLSDVGDLLQVTQMGMLDNKTYLDRLRDLISKIHNTTSKTATWNLKRDSFANELDQIILKLPNTNKIDRKIHQELEESYKAALDDIQDKEKEIEQFKALVEQLKAAKNKEEVKQIFLNQSSEYDRFEEVIGDAHSALGELPPIAQQVFYLEYIGESFYPQNNLYEGIRDLSDADKAKKEGYLIEVKLSDGEFALNEKEKKVRTSREKLKAVSDFLESIESDSEFNQWFEDENGFEIYECMLNERFWKKYFYSRW